MQKEGLDKVVEYAMFFRRSVLFLVTERHPSIDLFEINFASLKGNNVVDLDDGFVVALTSYGGNDKKGDSNAVEDTKETFDSETMIAEPAKDPSPSELNLSLPSFGENVLLPSNVNNEALKGVEQL